MAVLAILPDKGIEILATLSVELSNWFGASPDLRRPLMPISRFGDFISWPSLC
jgi:hypothetical protein